MPSLWYVYIVRCRDKTFYTGITNDLSRRIHEHNSDLGAKYTRGRTPVRLVYSQSCAGKPEALRQEAAIKKLTRADKLRMMKNIKSR